MGVRSRTDSPATSNNRLVDTERKMKQPGGKPKSLEEAFSLGSLISMPYKSGGVSRGERGVCCGVPWSCFGGGGVR